ncbi:lipase-like protein 3 [Sarcoptes scabiei]|uniref:Lipase-like protein 3 n=1 Tax=Sarcoptes scabiei TaxID=52283 RepID=A0A132AFL5_SARSC|nr:lipase-like protein 3 [Sarcoptes scabiei]
MLSFFLVLLHNADQDEPKEEEIQWAIQESIERWRSTNEDRTGIGSDTKIRRKRNEESSICYDKIGCFRNQSPFDYLNTLPASPESISTSFTLFTRRNLIGGEIIKLDYEDLLMNASTFDSIREIKIIIHGFGSSSKRPWVIKMTEALLKLGDFNIINVDWENGSKLPNYVQAAGLIVRSYSKFYEPNTRLVGKQIARLIRNINRFYHISPSNYHLIGFSLGAHVAGFTGQEIRNISRITGLDPASPLFEGYSADVRLDPTDALFVDVIHSNGDSFIRGGFGFFGPMGSVDFYPNGGKVQVGCNSALSILANLFYYGQWNILCNHRRAFHFFIESVHHECTFKAFSCSNYEEFLKGNCFDCGDQGQKCSNMGYYSNLSLGRGPMYLMTRDREPFCGMPSLHAQY